MRHGRKAASKAQKETSHGVFTHSDEEDTSQNVFTHCSEDELEHHDYTDHRGTHN